MRICRPNRTRSVLEQPKAAWRRQVPYPQRLAAWRWPVPYPQRPRCVAPTSTVPAASSLRGADQYRTRSVSLRGVVTDRGKESAPWATLVWMAGCSYVPMTARNKSHLILCCLRLPGELSSDQRTSWPADYLSPTEPILFFCRLSADPLASLSACQRHAARRCGYGTVTRPHRPAS